jgi:hypothetical protein
VRARASSAEKPRKRKAAMPMTIMSRVRRTGAPG